MTYGGHPGGAPDPFGPQNPFGPTRGDPSTHVPPGGWTPGFGSVPPPPPVPKTSTLATLSLLFAFVFAPAGAVLGHLALTEIRRYRQLGRERALVGITLSYTVIAVAVVSLVVWAAMGNSPRTTRPSVTAAPTAPQNTAPSTPAPPPAPLVPASALPTFLLTLDEVKGMVTAPDLNSSVDEPTVHVYAGQVYSPPECDTVFAAVDLLPSDPAARAAGQVSILARALQGPLATTGLSLVGQIVAHMDSPGLAATFVLRVQQRWRDCANKPVTSTDAQGLPLTLTAGTPTTAGAITTMQSPLGGGLFGERVIAVKNNIVVELSAAVTHPTDEVSRIAHAILDRIPG